MSQESAPPEIAIEKKKPESPVFDVMAVLGREECLGRLRDQGAA